MQLVKPIKREEVDKHLHISYSQLNTYLLCPMKYAHHYVWGTPLESIPMPLIFGKAIHKAAARFYLSFKNTAEKPPLDDVIGVFNTSFTQDINNSEVEVKLKKDETVKLLHSQGIGLLKLFYSKVSPQTIVAVEHPFSVKVPDVNGDDFLPVRLVGYLDLVERDQEGTYLVAELKTSSQRFSSLKLKYDLQATVYSYAMAAMRLVNHKYPTLVSYVVLIKTKKPAFENYFVNRTGEEHTQLVFLINNILQGIENKVFYRNTGWQCENCQFQRACLGKEE